jgi:integrase
MRVRLKYVNEYRDRHGKVRRYFRRAGQPRIPLIGNPGTPQFMEAYHAALAELRVRELGSDRSAPGSLRATIAAYYTHNSFVALSPSTRKMRRRILEKFREQHGDKRLAMLTRPHIAKMLSGQKPFAAHNWLKTLRGLMKFAVELGLCQNDPTDGIDRIRAKAGRIHTWTEAEIAQFETYHPVGSRARLAMALLLYSGQRRSDVVRMGPQHIKNGVLFVRQQKTDMEKVDEVLEIPVHPDLSRIIAASECGNLAFLMTGYGAPFTAAGFGNLFRNWCNEAGLPPACSAHGLRKAACRRLAEAGCSAPQIAAISGHKSLAEVQRYVEAANKATMAQAAMFHLVGERVQNDRVTNLAEKTD